VLLGDVSGFVVGVDLSVIKEILRHSQISTTAGTQPWDIKPRPATLLPAPTDNRLLQPLDQNTGTGHRHMLGLNPKA
jgi:hypothetical protein